MEEKESSLSASGTSDTQSPPAHIALPPPQPMMSFSMTVGSETPTIGGATAAASAPPPQLQPQPQPQPQPVSGAISSGSGKKRGRPRKYDSDGNLLAQYQTTASLLSSPPGFLHSSGKKSRGKPHGSRNWQLLAPMGELFASTAGWDFTPHVVTVNTGEDVAGKVISFTQKGPRGICILSANGAISNVTIRQPGSSGGILTYEGRFEILSLTGSFTIIDKGGARSRTGGMSVSLAGPDGRVIGGGVAGSLIAASPIQIVVGSFMPDGYKGHKKKHQREHTLASPTSPPSSHELVTMATPISESRPEGQVSVSPPSVLPFSGHHLGEGNQAANVSISERQTLNATPSLASFWNGSDTARPSPDINILAPSE